MKINEACEIAKDCGLETVGEAILNIKLHAISLFDYDRIPTELAELGEDYRKSGLKMDDLIG